MAFLPLKISAHLNYFPHFFVHWYIYSRFQAKWVTLCDSCRRILTLLKINSSQFVMYIKKKGNVMKYLLRQSWKLCLQKRQEHIRCKKRIKNESLAYSWNCNFWFVVWKAKWSPALNQSGKKFTLAPQFLNLNLKKFVTDVWMISEGHSLFLFHSISTHNYQRHFKTKRKMTGCTELHRSDSRQIILWDCLSLFLSGPYCMVLAGKEQKLSWIWLPWNTTKSLDKIQVLSFKISKNSPNICPTT